MTIYDEPEWMAQDRAAAFTTLGDFDVPAPTNGNGQPPNAGPDESWQRIDLKPVFDGARRSLTPTVLVCEDGYGLFYPGRVNGIHSDSGIGKSWIVALGVAEELLAEHHVIVVDFEDDESAIVSRLHDSLGVKKELIVEYLHYHAPKEPFDDDAVAAIEADARKYAVTLLGVDSLGEAFGLEGIDENKDVEVGPWLRRVTRRLADTGAAVFIVDHATKAADNPLHPSGSKRKRAAITGASYLVEATLPLTREHGGCLRLTVAKDRHGHRRRGAEACTIEFTVYPDGGMTAHLWPPAVSRRVGEDPEAKVRDAARAAVAAAKKAGRPLVGNSLVELMPKARKANKLAGIDHAAAEGALSTEKGPRNAVLYRYAHDLDDADQDPE